jgi:hypothetical protein
MFTDILIIWGVITVICFVITRDKVEPKVALFVRAVMRWCKKHAKGLVFTFKMVCFLIIFIASIRGGGMVAIWAWIIYGVYRLGVSDRKKHLLEMEQNNKGL